MNWLKRSLFSSSEDNNSGPYVLSLLGPCCLMASLFCTLLKYAHPLWPLIAAASIGFFLVWKGKKTGFILSLFLLSCALLLILRSQEPLWPSLLASSMALSGLLVFLGRQEALIAIQFRQRETLDLKKNHETLRIEVKRQEDLLSHDQNAMSVLIESLRAQLQNAQRQIFSLQSQLEEEQKVKDNWHNKHDQISSEVFGYQRKEKAFQHALEDAQVQLSKMKHAQAKEAEKCLLLQQELEDLKHEKSAHVLQLQHNLLKEQFDEKSEVLHQTRKELFFLETTFLTLQKQMQERACSLSDEDVALERYIEHMQEDCCLLEAQVEALQEIISVLVLPKKPLAPRKKKKTKAAQEDLLDLLRS